MNNLVVRNPIAEMLSDNWFDKAINNWMRPIQAEVGSKFFNPASMPTMDIVEGEFGSTATLEIPGVDKADIKVDIDEDMVTVTAETRKELEGTKTKGERYYGSIYRRFVLNHVVDETKSTAMYKDGILTLTLPKAEGKTSGHSIPVM
jgi:HSP20 family protein